ncbi:Melatonin receptor type 1C [Holothuria leucospilota]|uniref:Melatonin receptor type 1C n=1 Tax=Holothuria leucospilota TaxID=206669 RepID=A0A9Q1HJD3_HOLLE|nr:Melatonin receptor type 1C [Holothuria leucospilota]
MENGTAEVEVTPQLHRIIHSVLLIAMALVGVCGNTLVFIAFCLSRRLQTKTNIFVVNLAAADILTCVCLPIISLSLLVDEGIHTKSWLNTLCAIDIGVIKISLRCSFMMLVFIAVNRYVLITKSQETYKRMFQTKFTVIFLCISWMYPILFVTSQSLSGVIHMGYDVKSHSCNLGSDHHLLYGTLVFSTIALKITVIAYCYGRLYLFLRRHNKQMQKERVQEKWREKKRMSCY